MVELHLHFPIRLPFTFHISTSGLLPIRIDLELWILYTVDGTPWTGDQPSRKATTYTGQHIEVIRSDIHASSGIRTHDPSVSAGEDVTTLPFTFIYQNIDITRGTR
jgi:hypothetical protein